MKENYFTSKKFTNPEISFGFFSRLGGYSNKKYSSLNCSYNNKDNDILVKKNILKAQKKLSLHKKKIKFVTQVHSNKTIIINQNNFLTNFNADGIITKDKNISIAILTADCCPIFLFDIDSSFIACLHAGWKGAYSNIINSAVKKISKIQPNLNNIRAIIGPCLNVKNFEVSQDFKKDFLKINSNYKDFFTFTNHKNLFDLRNLIKFQLLSSKINNIEDLDIDTYSENNLFYSHRRSTHLNDIPTGRMINLIGFNN